MEKEAASFQVFPVRAVRFPVQKHTVYAGKTYGSASGNIKGDNHFYLLFSIGL